ncbi:MAG: ABC transporter permease subunit [Candidatus Bipolaricaulota bacterium]
MSGALLLLRKELLQAVRDRRTVLLTVLFPLVFYPLLFGLMGSMVEREQAQLAELVPRLAVVGEEDETLVGGLVGDPRVMAVWFAERDVALDQLDRGVLDAVLVVRSREERGVLGYDLTLYGETGDPTGQVALAQTREVLQDHFQQLVWERLEGMGVDPGAVEPPFTLQVVDTGEEGAMMRMLVARMLPYFLVLSILSGAMGFGAEITAGEKERGTISTLLSSRLSRTQIVLGKFLAVLAVALASTLVSAVGLFLGIRAFGAEVVGISPMAALWVFLLLLPLAMALAAVVLIVGTFARTQKEASAYLVPLLMLIVLVGIGLMIGAADPRGVQLAIPLAGPLAAIQRGVTGVLTYNEVGWALGSSGVLAGALLAAAVRIFRSERVLFRM